METLGIKIIPWMWSIAWIAFVITVVVLGPLSIFRRTRGWAGGGMMFAFFIFGATLWVWSLFLCLVLWGWWALIIGLVLVGIGVVPIAMAATGIEGMWSTFGQLIVVLIVTFGIRFVGAALLTSVADEEPEYEY